MIIRRANDGDLNGIWETISPAIQAGETLALPRDMTREAALAFWMGPDRETYVAEEGDRVIGTYYVRANQAGGGSHVANTAPAI